MARKRISVTNEDNNGRNQNFRDNYTGETMSRREFVSEINKGNYNNYHVRKVSGKATPVSNPDSNRNNNLG